MIFLHSPTETSISRGFPTAMFDDQRVSNEAWQIVQVLREGTAQSKPMEEHEAHSGGASELAEPEPVGRLYII